MYKWKLTFFAHIFKLSKSDSNVCYDMLRSTYKWKWDFKLKKNMQVPLVSAVNSVVPPVVQTCVLVLCQCTPPHGYNITWVEIFR